VKKREENYLNTVKKIYDAIEQSEGSIKNIVESLGVSMATVYRYLKLESELRNKLYRTRIQYFQMLIITI